MRHVLLFENFHLDEVGGKGKVKRVRPKSNNARLRSASAIKKRIKASEKYSTGPELRRLLDDGPRNMVWYDNSAGEENVLFTPGFYPFRDKGRDNLVSKATARLKEVIEGDPELHQMYLDELQRVEDEKLATEQRRKDEDEKKRQEKLDKENSLIEKLGLTEFYHYLKNYIWYVKRAPHSTPKLEWDLGPNKDKKNPRRGSNLADTLGIKDGSMVEGEYYIVRAGTYGSPGSNSRGAALMFPSVIKYMGKNTTSNSSWDMSLAAPIIEFGMYGPSLWTKVYTEEKVLDTRIDEYYPIADFLKNNKEDITRVNAELVKRIKNHIEKFGDKEPDFDPNWGMN